MVVLRFAGGFAALGALALMDPASTGETPKHGGIPNYVKAWKIKI